MPLNKTNRFNKRAKFKKRLIRKMRRICLSKKSNGGNGTEKRIGIE